MTEAMLSTDNQLAQRFVSDRVENFQRLYIAIKKLVLQIVDYYLDTYFPFETEASDIVKSIRGGPDEQGMVGLYQRFLQFLPIRFRVGVQGRYLYQEPSVEEKNLNEKEKIMTDPRKFLTTEMAELGIDPSLFDEIAALERSKGTGAEKLQQFESIVFDALGDQLDPALSEEIKTAIESRMAQPGE